MALSCSPLVEHIVLMNAASGTLVKKTFPQRQNEERVGKYI